MVGEENTPFLNWSLPSKWRVTLAECALALVSSGGRSWEASIFFPRAGDKGVFVGVGVVVESGGWSGLGRV